MRNVDADVICSGHTFKNANYGWYFKIYNKSNLTLQAPSRLQQMPNFTACFPIFKGMIFQSNSLPADESHETSCLFVIFIKAAKCEIIVCFKL